MATLEIVWLQSGGCGGCTMSLLCADARDLYAQLAAAGLSIGWHPALSEASGPEAIEMLDDYASGRRELGVLCVEGAMLRGPRGTGGFHRLAGTGKAMVEWVSALAARARYTVAIGSCAAYGGVPAAGENPTDACGLQYEGAIRGGTLGAGYRSGAGLPVINVAGCPTHPGWIVDTLMAIGLGGFAAGDLDPVGRPRLYADQLVHHGCSRNEYYEFKASADKASDLGCLMENLGCKGTQAHADCNLRTWNGEGSCTEGGYACINCVEPGFEEPGHPFARTPKLAGIPIGLPADMPKAWFVALAALSKSATPRRVRENSRSDHLVVTPSTRKPGPK
ncbi:MAG: HupU protein [Burkholderiales bacterium]